MKPSYPECPHCGKETHRSEAAAIRVALRASSSFARPLRWYRCPSGSGWHLTSQVKRAKTKRPAKGGGAA